VINRTQISIVMDRINCSLCCDKTADSVMMPCGHAGLCNDCAMKMWQRTEMCHLCRNPIENVVLIPETPSMWVKPKLTTGRQAAVQATDVTT
jgi:hypothetical protein